MSYPRTEFNVIPPGQNKVVNNVCVQLVDINENINITEYENNNIA